MSSRETNINNFLLLLNTKTLDELKKSHDLYVKPHDKLPIIIINYGKIENYKKNQNIDACRGLVIEKNTNRIISRGFDRFIPKYNDPKNTINISRSTIKEDGSLIFMFRYDGKWYLSTMHDFADNFLPNEPKMTYSELFLEIIKQPLDEFGESLINQIKENCDFEIMTFCFEMCSIYNRVIRTYENPTLYLITAFGDLNGNKEYKIKEELNLPENVKFIKEIKFEKQSYTFEQLEKYVIEIAKDDITFEGMVIESCSGIRVKVKNPLYLVQHKLKYRGWSKCTAKLIIPLILNNLCDKIIKNVNLCINDEPLFIEETSKRIEFYKFKINSDYKNVCNIFDLAKELEKKSDFIIYIKTNYKDIFDIWKKLFSEAFNNKVITKELFYKNYLINIKKIYKKDYFIDNEHPNTSCKFDYEESFCESIIQKYNNDGISTNPYICYCGSPMIISRLKYDLTRYKMCHCGKKYGYTIYYSGSYLSVCSNKNCLCTHEINQKTLLPLGYPSDMYCKSLRLIIHELIKNSNLSKEECYKKISIITNKSKEFAHMSKFGIKDLINILKNFTNQS